MALQRKSERGGEGIRGREREGKTDLASVNPLSSCKSFKDPINSASASFLSGQAESPYWLF